MTASRRPGPGQLDLLAPPEPARPAGLPLCLFDSPARGLAAREAEFDAWREQHGSFGSLVRSHAWTLRVGGVPGEPTSRCQAAVLSCDVRDASDDPGCACPRPGALLYRAACRSCDWEGDPRDGENPAAEDALGHAWPGWRDVPVVPARPSNPKAEPAWKARILALYPAGWLEDGGPYRTARTGQYDTRHVPGRTPWGGYDIAAVPAAESGAAA
jgi:hypothetical protein